MSLTCLYLAHKHPRLCRPTDVRDRQKWKGYTMALSRHQRRKIARQRQLAKAVRVHNAIQAREREARQAIVRDNLNSPRPNRFVDGRGLYRSCLADIGGQSHRGYVCQNASRPSFSGSIDDRGIMR